MLSTNEIVIDPAGNEHEVVDYRDDYIGSKFGFWLFLFTELMMFGTMFLVFAIYFYQYSEEFVHHSGSLNLYLGGTNTIILLLSTYTMGLATLKLKKGRIKGARVMTYITLLFAVVFLVIKGFEWSAEFSHDIFPDSETLVAMSDGSNIFFGLYFTMTGLHGFHIILGILLMLTVLYKIKKGTLHPEHYIFMKNTTLYWDFVHLIWVFVFPIFYMIGA